MTDSSGTGGICSVGKLANFGVEGRDEFLLLFRLLLADAEVMKDVMSRSTYLERIKVDSASVWSSQDIASVLRIASSSSISGGFPLSRSRTGTSSDSETGGAVASTSFSWIALLRDREDDSGDRIGDSLATFTGLRFNGSSSRGPPRSKLKTVLGICGTFTFSRLRRLGSLGTSGTSSPFPGDEETAANARGPHVIGLDTSNSGSWTTGEEWTFPSEGVEGFADGVRRCSPEARGEEVARDRQLNVLNALEAFFLCVGLEGFLVGVSGGEWLGSGDSRCGCFGLGWAVGERGDESCLVSG